MSSMSGTYCRASNRDDMHRIMHMIVTHAHTDKTALLELHFRMATSCVPFYMSALHILNDQRSFHQRVCNGACNHDNMIIAATHTIKSISVLDVRVHAARLMMFVRMRVCVCVCVCVCVYVCVCVLVCV